MDGNITDISVNQDGIVQAIAIDGGRVVSSTQDGRRVAPTLPILTSTNIGSFDGCPGCLNLIQQGGAVKGIVLEGGRLKGVIAGFGPLPGEDLLRQFSPPLPQPAPTPEVTAPVGPYLQLAGTLPVGANRRHSSETRSGWPAAASAAVPVVHL